jgi:cell division septation protein DedD
MINIVKQDEIMKANIKQRIRTLSILWLSCSFIFSTGCSGLRDWSGYNASTSRVRGNNFISANSDLNQFYSSIRPIKGTVESDYRLARYFQKRGKHKFAVEELLKAIYKDPSFIKAYNALGVSYDHLGHFDLAVKSYEFALTLNPELDYVYNNLGYSYLLNGNFDAAINAFQKAVALDDANKRYRNNLGLAYARKGQTDMAFDEFKRAGDESGAQYKMAQVFNDQHLSRTPEPTGVETFSEGIAPLDEIQKDTSEPLLLAGSAVVATLAKSANAQLISEKNPAHRLIPDDFSGIELPEKSVKNEVKISNLNLPRKNAAEVEDLVSYTVQVSASGNLADATLLMETLIKKGYPCPYLNKVGNDRPFYRVRLGTFNGKEEADRWIPDLTHTLGCQPFIAFEDKRAEKITSGKQNCFDAKVIAPSGMKCLNIEICNGNGVRHMARNVGIYLNLKGFRTARLTNADHFNYPETKIYYQKGYRQDALRLAKEIPGRQKTSNVVEQNQIMGRSIKVLIGKDLVPFRGRMSGTLISNASINNG